MTPPTTPEIRGRLPLKSPLVARQVDGDLLLEDRASESKHRLNSVAGLIWQLCDGTNNSVTIAERVATVFDMEPAEVARDVDHTLAEFAELGLIQSPSGPSRETDVLLRCVRMAIGTEQAGPINDSLRNGFDWNYLVRIARFHGVVAPLHATLAARPPDEVPRDVLDRLRGHYEANGRGNRKLLCELLELLSLFDGAGVPAISLRGPIFSISVYGDLNAREFQDLDIFVPANQFARAKELLRARGYKALAARDTDASFESSDGAVSVDLQCALARPVWRFPISLDHLWDRLVPIRIGDSTVWQPRPADHALILSAHSAKHCWSSLKWIVDFAAFVGTHGNLDWGDVLERARSLGGERQLLLGLRLISDTLHVELPKETHRPIATDPSVAALANELAQQLFVMVNEPTHQGSYGHIRGGWLYIRTRERVRDKIPYALDLARYQLTHVKEFITPNVYDREMVSLPDSLAFLYYLVRPFRLARDLVVRLVEIPMMLKGRRQANRT